MLIVVEVVDRVDEDVTVCVLDVVVWLNVVEDEIVTVVEVGGV